MVASRSLGMICLGIAQQLIKQGSPIILSLVIAMSLPAAEFGVYAIAIAVHGLFHLLHAAYLSEPMQLFAGSEHRDTQKSYFAVLARSQLIAWPVLMLVMMLLVLVFYLAGSTTSLTMGLGVLVIIQPLAAWANYYERRLFLISRVALAMVGATAQLLLVVALLVLAQRFGWLSVPSALAVLGVGYVAAVVAHVVMLRRFPVRDKIDGRVPIQEVARRHIRFGTYSAVGHGLWWLAQNVYTFVTGAFLSLTALAEFKLLITLSNIGVLPMSALAVVLTPMITTASTSAERRHVMKLAGAIVVALGTLFAIVFVLLAPLGIPLLFGEKFNVGLSSILICSVYPAVAGAQFLATTFARARGVPQIGVRGTATGLALGLGPGTALLYWYAVPGSMAAQVLTMALIFLAIAAALRSHAAGSLQAQMKGVTSS